MAESLLTNEAVLVSIAMWGSILLVVFWETFSPRRKLSKPTWIRWLNNAALWLLDATLYRWLLAGFVVSVSVYADQYGFGFLHVLSMPEPAAIVVGLLMLDFFAALKHRLFHIIPALWSIHVVHHSDLDCDISTSLRHHPLDLLFDTLLSLLIVISVGAPPFGVLIFYVIITAHNSVRHGNVYIPSHIDRTLRLFVVTPDFHRIHHSSIQEETNSNYGVIFPWWDWMMQTYCAEPAHGQEDFEIGLEYFRGDGELWLPRLLAQPFRRQAPIVQAIGKAREISTPVPTK